MKPGDLVRCATGMFDETAIGIVVKYLPDFETWPNRVPGAWQVLYEGELDEVLEHEMEVLSESR